MLKLHRHSQNLETLKFTGDFSFFIIENLTLDYLHSSCHWTIVLHCTRMLQSNSETFCIHQVQMERTENKNPEQFTMANALFHSLPAYKLLIYSTAECATAIHYEQKRICFLK